MFFVILHHKNYKMKNRLYFFAFAILLFSSCDPAPATFKIKTQNFGANSVMSVISGENGEMFKAENITNGNQTFKINDPKKGYAILKVEDGTKKQEYFFYLGKGNFVADLNAKNDQYPFKDVPSTESKEFISFYKLKDKLSKELLDSLGKSEFEMDHATQANVMQRAKNVDAWREKKVLLDLDIIKSFAKENPQSVHTLFLLDQLGRVDVSAKIYLTIFNTLSNEVKESKRGKKLLEEINQANQMMAGSEMPNVEGYNPKGQKFDKQVLKKVNLIICWTSYNGKSRVNNRILTNIYEKYKDQDVEFIGVSYDKKKDWWLNVIKDDKLIWPQYSDLQGAKSPNAKNLSNYNITYFFIVDKTGKVLTNNNDLSINFVEDEIKKALREVKN